MFLFILQRWIQSSQIYFDYRFKMFGNIILTTENSHLMDIFVNEEEKQTV